MHSRASVQPGWFSQEDAAPTQTPTSRGTTYLDALRWALHDEMAADERVVLLGEDIGIMGGAFRVTEGLQEEFGEERVIDTPLAEIAIVGTSIGLAVSGWRPVAELQFADFVSCAYDQLVNEAAKLHYRFGIAVPLVVRCPSGGGLGAGPFHSQCPEGIFTHIPGLKVVCPGTVQDAYDLLRAAIRDPDPVLFFEQKALYRSIRSDLDRDSSPVPLGRAVVRRPGRHLTAVTYGAMVPRVLAAAEDVHAEGVEVEVVDLRSLVPLDIDTVADSVTTTGRLVVVHEATRTSGFAAEIVTSLAESGVFFSLDAPPARVAAPDTPVPFAKPLEDHFVPSVARIAETFRRVAAA